VIRSMGDSIAVDPLGAGARAADDLAGGSSVAAAAAVASSSGAAKAAIDPNQGGWGINTIGAYINSHKEVLAGGLFISIPVMLGYLKLSDDMEFMKGELDRMKVGSSGSRARVPGR